MSDYQKARFMCQLTDEAAINYGTCSTNIYSKDGRYYIQDPDAPEKMKELGSIDEVNRYLEGLDH